MILQHRLNRHLPKARRFASSVMAVETRNVSLSIRPRKSQLPQMLHLHLKSAGSVLSALVEIRLAPSITSISLRLPKLVNSSSFAKEKIPASFRTQMSPNTRLHSRNYANPTLKINSLNHLSNNRPVLMLRYANSRLLNARTS